MSVKVNLLPQATSQRHAASRHRMLAGGVGAVLLLVLAALTLLQNGRVSDAEARLATEEAQLASVNAEVARLSEFADLEERLQAADEDIRTALADEASLAGILQDVALVMPADAELESITVAIDASQQAPEEEDATGTDIGTLAIVGRSLNNHAPGLERFLLEFEKVASFRGLYFTNSVLDDPDDPYPTFTVEAQLGPEALTGRYDEGVPEELR